MITHPNDLILHKYIKSVEKYGISRQNAKIIVKTAFEAGNGKNVEMYIHYAITLQYGLTLPKQKITV